MRAVIRFSLQTVRSATTFCHTTPKQLQLRQLRSFSTNEPKASVSMSITACHRISPSELNIQLPNNSTLKFHAKWLWHNCTRHREPDSGQRFLPPEEVVKAPLIKSTYASADAKSVIVEWDDNTQSAYDVAWLIEHDYSDERLKQRFRNARPPTLAPQSPRPGQRHTEAKDVPTFEFSELMSSEKRVYEWVRAINEVGLTIVKNAPTTEGTVLKVAKQIANPMWTIYGEMWEVAVMPNPINIAYSPVMLDQHIDLVYYESPPGLQLLHCRRFDDDVVGGASTFIDGFAVAEEFRRLHPEHFKTFCEVPATFQKIHYRRASPAHIQVQRPHIVVDPLSSEITAVFWAPPFEGPLQAPPASVPRYYAAYEAFSALIHDMQKGFALIEYRMQPGDVSVFNNRRMLHGRRHFYAKDGAKDAQRVLQGCYVNVDDFKSRCFTLASKFGDIHDVKRVGNNNVF